MTGVQTCALPISWAIPAALRGGQEYADAIFWHQSVGRISGADDAPLDPHHQGWWWFLPFVPVVLFPWAVWPPAWRALRGLRRQLEDPGLRWCLAWVVPAFVLHSLIGGKQVHYLIPLVAPALLLVARLLTVDGQAATRRDLWPVSAIPFLDDATLIRLGAGNREAALHDWGDAIGLLPGTGALLLLAVLLLVARGSMLHHARMLAGAGIALLVMLHATLGGVIRPAYDPAPLARRIAEWQQRGIPVAYVGGYSGQYQFAGRLTAFPEQVDRTLIGQWAQAHPGGIMLITFRPGEAQDFGMGPPEADLPHRGRRIGIWRIAQPNR